MHCPINSFQRKPTMLCAVGATSCVIPVIHLKRLSLFIALCIMCLSYIVMATKLNKYSAVSATLNYDSKRNKNRRFYHQNIKNTPHLFVAFAPLDPVALFWQLARCSTNDKQYSYSSLIAWNQCLNEVRTLLHPINCANCSNCKQILTIIYPLQTVYLRIKRICYVIRGVKRRATPF